MASEFKPLIFPTQSQAPEASRVVDAYTGATRELFFVRNPKFKKQTPDGEAAWNEYSKNEKLPDVWIFYPDTKILVRTLSQELYFELRTARNRDVITKEEQQKYRAGTVGVAGLSVGSSALNALVQSGGPKNLKIADFDTLEVSNLNRLRARLTDIGSSKTEIAAREAWLLDPFADIELWKDGVSKTNLEEFLTKPRLDIFVDQMDTIGLKILGRQICRKLKIPVVMATDNGDGIILDIERFDKEQDRPLFHGLIEEMDPTQLSTLTFPQWLKIATKIVGPEYLTGSMQGSILEIGKSIAAVPQLGPSAHIAGAAIAFSVRRILNGQPLESGRYIINLEETLVPGYKAPEAAEQRKSATEKFKQAFS